MTTREEEVRRLLEETQQRSKRSLTTALSRELSRTWEAVMAAHDNTNEAVPLREQGMMREFYLLALEDLNAASKAIEQGQARLSQILVNDMNLARSTVAESAGVSRTKMNRWIDG